jgi:hypothetical protein
LIEGTSPNIFRRNGLKNISQKQRYSRERGPRGWDDSDSILARIEQNPNGVLAQIQRRLKAKKPIDAVELERLEDILEEISGTAEGGGMTLGWAEKLKGEIEDHPDRYRDAGNDAASSGKG